MPITITGAKYDGNITSFAGRTLTASGVNFIEDDFDDARIVGLWTSGGQYRGLAWVRVFVSSTQLEMESAFLDRDGLEVIPSVGDQVLVSLNYADAVTTGLVLDNNTVTLNDGLRFGTNNISNSVCFYDENKAVDIENDGGGLSYVFQGGLFVHGHLLNYEERSFFNPVTLNSNDNGNGGDQFRVVNLSAKVWWLGGTIQFQQTPARFPGGSNGDPAEWQKWWGIETNGDIVTPFGGANWSSNAENQQFVNCRSILSAFNAIGFRVANSDFQGGLCKITGGLVISAFGADAAGNYTIGAPAGQRFQVVDIGNNPAKTSFWRSGGDRVQEITVNNVISTDYRFGRGINPGSVSSIATGNINFIDSYTNLLSNTKVVIIETNNGVEASSGESIGGGTLNLSVNYANVLGHTVTVNETDWEWGAFAYGSNIISGVFSVSNVETIGGTAIDVIHGAALLQGDDLLITERERSLVQAYPVTTTFDGTTLTVVGDGNTIQTITANQFYDIAANYLFENYQAETQTIVTRLGDNINAVANDINIELDFIDFVGSMTLTPTREVTLLNGSTVSGGIIDINGDSFLSFDSINNWAVFDTPPNSQGAYPNPPLGEGTGSDFFRFNFDGTTTYYIKADGIDLEPITPSFAGETEVSLSQAGILTGIQTTTNNINTRLGFIPRSIFVDATLMTNGDGSSEFPFNNISDAIIKANLDGIRKIVGTGQVTLTQSIANLTLTALGEFDIDFNGQDITSASFEGCILSGTAAGNTVTARKCILGYRISAPAPVSMPQGSYYDCTLINFTCTTSGDYKFLDSVSGVAGSNDTIFSCLPNVGTQFIQFRRWSGGLDLRDVDTQDIVSVDIVSGGIVSVSGTGGSVFVRGILENNVVDNSAGSVTINDLGVVNTENLNNFDPINDTVARVTLVDTTTTNSDMRGTEGANTVTPTNISATDIRLELATELARLDANVSSVAYDDTALTNLINALPTLSEMESSSLLTAVADITGLSTHDANGVVTALLAVSDSFKSDVSGIETRVEADVRQNELTDNLDNITTKVDLSIALSA